MRTLSTVVRQTSNLVLICDAQACIHWVNDAFIEKNGYALEEARGKRGGDLMSGPSTDAILVSRRGCSMKRATPSSLKFGFAKKR